MTPERHYAPPAAGPGSGTIAVVIAVLLLGAAPHAAATIHYTISLAQPEQQTLGVTMTVPIVEEELIVQMPAWNALYQIRDFTQRIHSFRATSAQGAALPVEKLDKNTWRIRGTGAVRIEYAIFWDEPGAFSSEFNSQHAFLNLAMVLPYVPARRAEQVRLDFADLPAGWRLAAALTSTPEGNGFTAASYDDLVDAPVEAGTFEEWRFQAGAARIRVVVHGTNWNRAQLTDMLTRIVGYQTALMREAPFEEFLFLYHVGVGGGGGMEHLNSTAIHIGASAGAAGISAHEFFHLWNVKRIRPQSLEPGCPLGCPVGYGVDHTRENWTRALWFAEGVTSTYTAYTLVRSGLITPRQFYDDLAAQINLLQSRPARLWKSAEEASLDAWLERYPLYVRPAFSISYYNKGQILGILLDILIRDATDNHASLDDVLRLLNAEFAHRGRFYDESRDLRAAVERVAGRSFQDFFSRYVSGTDALPLRDVLALAGLELTQRGRGAAEFGFLPARGDGPAMTVGRVDPASEAAQAGVRAGDLLAELEGAPFPRNFARWLREREPGQAVSLVVERGGQRVPITFRLGEGAERPYDVNEAASPADKQRRIREGLLRGIP